MPWVDEDSQSDPAQVAGLAARNVTEQVRDDALRQVVGLDLVVDSQLCAGIQHLNTGPIFLDVRDGSYKRSNHLFGTSVVVTF